MSLLIIYASGSGHTAYVVEVLAAFLAKKAKKLDVHVVRAEEADEKDLTKSDVVILASGTWNTGGVEGQMHPFMYEFLKKRAKGADLQGQSATVIALGDERYFYTARAGEHMRSYLVTHGAEIVCQPLTIVNEPYSQEAKIEKWATKFLSSVS